MSARVPCNTSCSSAEEISAASSGFMVILSKVLRAIRARSWCGYYHEPVAKALAKEVTSFRMDRYPPTNPSCHCDA